MDKVYPRTPPRLARVCIDQPIYFITACTDRRRAVLAQSYMHDAFRSFSVESYERKNVAVGRYVLMPDHMHLFVRGSIAFELSNWMRMLTGHLTKAFRKHGHSVPLWQRGFFDHVLRSSESYSEKWRYVHDNPVRAGLSASADEWPYAGEIIRIER